MVVVAFFFTLAFLSFVVLGQEIAEALAACFPAVYVHIEVAGSSRVHAITGQKIPHIDISSGGIFPHPIYEGI